MATYVKEYELVLTRCVAIDAANEEEARSIFKKLELDKNRWAFYRYEVVDYMMDYLGNNMRDVPWSVEPAEYDVYHDEEFKEDVIDYNTYINEED